MSNKMDWYEPAGALRSIELQNSDKTMPTEKWEFNEEVTAVFDDMLANSIPDYESMRNLTTQIGKRFLTGKEDMHIVDLGASKGRAIEPFIGLMQHAKERLHTYLFEVSEPMLRTLSDNPIFHDSLIVSTPIQDVRTNYCPTGAEADLILSILTIQFTPIEYRARILSKVYDTLRPGGGFIFVEKVIGNTNTLDDLMIDTYYEMKAGNGYSQEQIEAKRKSLEGVLVPVTAKWNEDMLYAAGFKQVDCFYRNLNFAGWIAIK